MISCKNVFILAVCAATEYEVDVYNSKGYIISDGQTHTLYDGDFIYCKFPGDVIGPQIHYGWMKIENEEGDFALGPKFVSVENSADMSNK